MKLMVGRPLYTRGFALPTILLVSTVMLAILMASIGAAAGSRVALDSQYYNQLAQQAAESGVTRAKECLSKSGYTAQWSTKASGKDLRPDSDCTGTSVFSNAYVVGVSYGTGPETHSRVRTTYTIDAPSGAKIGTNLKVTGITELVRTSSPFNVWRRYTQEVFYRIEPQGVNITCSSLTVGETGPGGGTVFYKDTSTNPNTCYEAAPQGWYPATAPSDPQAEWGCSGVNVAGASGLTMGTGKQNTDSIVASNCQPQTAGNRVGAIIAANYAGGGKSDWYLPSRDELVRMNAQKTAIGGMDGAYYWLSTQANVDSSTVVGFGSNNGIQLGVYKSGPHHIRPIRSFTNEIAYPGFNSCQEGFIGVPGNSKFGTSDFCVAKYEAKEVGGKAVSQASGSPYVNISQNEAMEAASAACDSCHLITEAEWLTIAHDVLNVANNWSGGSVGSGYIYSGHNDNSPANALAASTDDSDGYFGTGNTSGTQRRTLTLSNGQVIWDLAGNVYEWTSGQIGAGKPGGSGLAYREWNSIGVTGSIVPNPIPSYGTSAASGWTSSLGIGRLYSNSDDTVTRAFARSAAWSYGSNSAGILTLRLDISPTTPWGVAGFRIAK